MTASRASGHRGLFPIDEAERFFRQFTDDVQRDGACIRWPSHDGITELSIEPVQLESSDGSIIQEIVTLRHVSPPLQEISADAAGSINRWATLSSMIPATPDTPAALVAKIGIFSTDHEAAATLYSPMICMEAALIGWHAACLARQIFRMNPVESPLAMTDQPPPFDHADFEALDAFLQRKGLPSTRADGAVTVEFPWDPGAVSAVFTDADLEDLSDELGIDKEDAECLGGRTSLFQLMTTEHPLYGHGIQTRLEIPLPTDGERMSRWIDVLNRWELAIPELPPMLGAWCEGQYGPAFVSFFPTQFCMPGMLHHLVGWAFARHGAVRDWVESASGSLQ